MKKITATILVLIVISLLSSGCGSLAKILGIAVVASEWDKSQKKKMNLLLFTKIITKYQPRP